MGSDAPGFSPETGQNVAPEQKMLTPLPRSIPDDFGNFLENELIQYDFDIIRKTGSLPTPLSTYYSGPAGDRYRPAAPGVGVESSAQDGMYNPFSSSDASGFSPETVQDVDPKKKMLTANAQYEAARRQGPAALKTWKEANPTEHQLRREYMKLFYDQLKQTPEGMEKLDARNANRDKLRAYRAYYTNKHINGDRPKVTVKNLKYETIGNQLKIINPKRSNEGKEPLNEKGLQHKSWNDAIKRGEEKKSTKWGDVSDSE
jgi:uncharacterized protein YnzC (UPF0291/DUF896 family)